MAASALAESSPSTCPIVAKKHCGLQSGLLQSSGHRGAEHHIYLTAPSQRVLAVFCGGVGDVA